MRRLIGMGAVAALLWSGTAAAQTAEDAAAIERGRAALQWVQSYSCPKLGSGLSVQGLATPADVERVRNENWSFVNTRLGAMAEAIRARRVIEAEIAQSGGKPSRAMQQNFADLDSSIAATSARATSALAQWLLASWVDMSKIDGDFDILNGGANPLQPFIRDGAALRSLAQNFGGALSPVTAKYDQCLAAMQAQVIDFNLPQIRAAADQRKTSQQMTELLAMFDGLQLPPDSEGAMLVAGLRSKRDSLIAEEQRQAELARAAADQAARARLVAEAEAGRAVAARYVAAINAGRIDAAIALLDDDVFLASPQGNARGRQSVADRMRKAQSEADGSSQMGAVELDQSYRVFSRVRGSRGSGRIFFEFLHSRISRISLVQD